MAWLSRRGLVILTVVGALIAIGCGDDDSGGSQAPNRSVKAGESLLDRIKRTNALQIGTGSFPPGTYIDGDSQEWTGFDIDFLTALAKKLGVDPYITYMPAAALIPALETGRIDVWVDLYKTPERAEVLDFSDTWIYYFDDVYVHSTDPKVQDATMEALSGKRVATCRGCAEEAYIKRIPGAKPVLYDTVEQSLLEVASGRVDAAIQPRIYGDYALESNANTFKIKSLGPVPRDALGGEASATPSFFGVKKGKQSASFLAEMNALIEEWRTSGKLAETLKKYGMDDPRYVDGE